MKEKIREFITRKEKTLLEQARDTNSRVDADDFDFDEAWEDYFLAMQLNWIIHLAIRTEFNVNVDSFFKEEEMVALCVGIVEKYAEGNV